MSKGSAIVGFILCFLAGMGLMWGIDRGAGAGRGGPEIAAEGGVWSDDAAAVPVSSKDPVWGSRTAPVTIVEFTDYQCPYCSRADGTVKQIRDKYGPEKVRVVLKHNPLPFHQQATPAHEAAVVVHQLGGSKALWKFHELCFANQRALTPESFPGWAEQAGVERAKFDAQFKAGAGKEKVQQDLALGRQVGVSGTPAFFINGVFLSGAQPLPTFTAEIDKQLAEAQQETARGTAADQIYVKLCNKNKQQQAKPEEKPKPPPEKPAQDDKTVWKVPVADSDPVKGGKDALVTIVEFSDFQCPFCSRVEATVKQVMDTYGDKVRVVWKDNPLPFHKRAEPASELAREAQAEKGDKGFWAAHGLLFENQQKLEDEDLFGYAEKLGLNAAKVKRAIADSKYRDLLDAAQDVAMDFNASGTPHFFINGRRLVGAQPFEQFKGIIDEEIAKAEALLKKGVKPKDLYAELTKDGKEPPPPEKKEAGEPPKNAPWKGAERAKVVIHEFSDFQCPFCSRVEGTMKQVVDEFGKQVKIVWRNKPLPFHDKAGLAAEAAMEAYAQKGNEGFWAMHGKLFANQQELGREALEKYAKEMGLDVERFKKALDDHTHKAAVDRDVADSDKIGIDGTPGFIIGGYFLSGAQPYPAFKKLIKRALKDAKK
ncbi:MAG: thioredoxin domain-containing protein [Deltaproteobacteria bacterium]|nr:thioredoxin domain-containing protein [Deltaproteobacteria bacterium]